MPRIAYITGERVSLVIPESSDIDLMYQGINNRSLQKFLGNIGPITFEQEKEYLQNHIEKNRDTHFFMIMINDTQEIIGSLGCHEVNLKSRNAVLGIAIYNENRMGKGYGSEALKIYLEYLFNDIGLHKVKLGVYAFNPRAIASYTKLGFQEIGRFKEEKYIAGAYHDEIWMEILRTEWDKA